MAKVVSTYTNDAGHEIAVYESGAEYDTTAKHLVKPAAHTVITEQNATAYNRQRQQLKRDRLLLGAARTLDRTDGWTTPNDLDVVEALGEAVMMKALNPDNAKQVDAARFILQEGGMAEAKQAETVNNTMNVIALPEDVARAIADLRRLMVERASAEAVDSE